MVTCIELTEMQTASVLIQPLYVFIKPYVLSSDSGNTLGLQLNLLDCILRHQITP